MTETKEFNFFGSDYNESRDYERLAEHTRRVYKCLKKDPKEQFTIAEISLETKVPESSVGSHISYIRRDMHYTVPKQYIEGGLYVYWLGDKMTAEEIQEMRMKKHKPIGDKKLWGEFMRQLYIVANSEDGQPTADLGNASVKWQYDMINRIREGSE